MGSAGEGGAMNEQETRIEPPVVTVQCLGTFAVTVRGTPIRRWQAGKARALFQYLLLRRGTPVPRGTLLEALWPDADTSLSLRVAVHALRQILAVAGSPPGRPERERDPDEDTRGLALLSLDTAYL